MRARLICSRAAAYIMDQRVQLATAMTLENVGPIGTEGAQ